MNSKESKRLAVKKLFIETASDIINEKGIENITIRKVAQITEYNSATLYSYFDNLDHLIFLASLNQLKEYTGAIELYINEVNSPLLKAMKIWECFMHYSLKNPKIYHTLFFNKREKDLNRYLIEYKKIFSDNPLSSVFGIASPSGIHERSDYVLAEAVEKKEILAEDISELNEMMMYIYQGLLSQVIYDPFTKTDKLENRFFKYMIRIFESYGSPLVRNKIRNLKQKDKKF